MKRSWYIVAVLGLIDVVAFGFLISVIHDPVNHPRTVLISGWVTLVAGVGWTLATGYARGRVTLRSALGTGFSAVMIITLAFGVFARQHWPT